MGQNAFASAIPIERLTDAQKKAVFHTQGPLLVLAGPGSGKTSVITGRIAALIDSGVRPYNICAITFTNKAADQMRQKLAGVSAAGGVHISTFHSLCVRILHRYAEKARIKSNFTIYDEADQVRCMKEAVKSCQVDTTNFMPAKMLAAVSLLKNDLEDVESVRARADDYFTKILADVYAAYQKILMANNALDFDDLLIKTAFLLRDRAEVRAELNSRFNYLLVDEYQDTNHAQYQIAKALALEHRNICATGDPDQSIYRWRGADIGNILAFEKDWPDAVVVRLQENFRSTPDILETADKLIAFNKKRKQKILVPTKAAGGNVVINTFGDDLEEAAEVGRQVKELIDEGADLNNIAVFYRVNSMSRMIEEAFINNQITYQIVRGVEFYSRKEIRDMLSYLKLTVNTDDNIAFVRAITTHPRGIGKTTLDRLGGYANNNMLSLYQAAQQAGRIESIAKPTRNKLAEFAGMIEQFKSGLVGEVAPLMSRVFAETGMMAGLNAGGEKQQTAIENIGELINAAAEYDRQSDEPSLLDYLQTIALYSDTDAYNSAGGRVSLMTLHAAKGLEFDNVFIIGLEDGILPHERSGASQDNLEEERRLFFVGITRARYNLYISYARHRMVRGQFLRSVASQFLYEIGYAGSEYKNDFNNDVQDSYGVGDMDEWDKFVVNELVKHEKFGAGRVREFLNLGENSIVVVKFNSGKTKSLMVKYANLVRVGK